MYTCKVDKTNHAITIIDKTTKRGITMRNIGEEMAEFLVTMAQKANQGDENQPEIVSVKPQGQGVDL